MGNVYAVDLFCGVGGLTHGLRSAGIKVIAGIDLDPTCKFPFEQNNEAAFIHRDMADVTSEEVASLFPRGSRRVLAGCAPCQPFSRYARGNRPNDVQKWGLLEHFSRLIKGVEPEIVSMENVPELKAEKVFESFVWSLRELGYRVSYSDVYCPDYGLAQQRTRLVLLASKEGEFRIGPPTHSKGQYNTVRHAIGNLSPLQAGQASRTDKLHRASNLEGINLRRIKHSKPGGCWRDWPRDLVAGCHSRENGKTYPAVYGRMEWDKPAPTITTQFFGYGNGRFGHPSQHRAISIREGAILQSFPTQYEFHPEAETLSFATLGRMIGNAVPVRLGEIIGDAILEHVSEGSKT